MKAFHILWYNYTRHMCLMLRSSFPHEIKYESYCKKDVTVNKSQISKQDYIHADFKARVCSFLLSSSSLFL